MSIATEITQLKQRVATAYDAVAAKGGTVPTEKDTYHLSSAIESIPTGGGSGGLDAFIGKDSSVDDLKLDTATKVRQYACYQDTNITSITAPNVTTVEQYAFDSSKIQKVDMPQSKSFGAYAFNECTSLTSFNGQPENVGDYSFTNCKCHFDTSKLKMLYMHSFENTEISGSLTLPNFAFSGVGHSGIQCFCGTKITDVDISARLVGGQGYYTSTQKMFGGCPNLSSVILRNSTMNSGLSYQGMLSACPNLQYVNITGWNNIPQYTFDSSGTNVANGLTVILSGYTGTATKTLGQGAFRYTNLRVLDIRTATSVPTLANINALTAVTDINNLSILVPKSLENDFKTATNWSNAAIVNHIYGV